MILAGGATRAVDASERGDMRLDGDRVTARIAGAPLREVLSDLGRLSGARVEWRDAGGNEPVAIEFAGLQLDEAIARLLRDRSYILVVGQGDARRLRRIVIMPGPPVHDGSERGGPLQQAEPPRDPGGLEPAVTAILEDPDPLVRARMLSSLVALGPDDPRRELVLARLVADPDPGVRQAALRVQDEARGELPRRAVRRRRRVDSEGGR